MQKLMMLVSLDTLLVRRDPFLCLFALIHVLNQKIISNQFIYLHCLVNEYAKTKELAFFAKKLIDMLI